MRQRKGSSRANSDSPKPRPGDVLTIGDGFGWIAKPLNNAEKAQLEKALGRPLDAKAFAELFDAMRCLIVMTAARDKAPTLKLHEENFQKISDASDALLRAIKDAQSTPLVRTEIGRALGTTEQFRTFLISLERTGAAAHGALAWLKPKTSKRGPKENFADRAFLWTVATIASSAGADMSLPSHRDCATSKKEAPQGTFLAFAEHALWIAVDRANGMSGVSANSLSELRSLDDRSERALVGAIESAL